MQEPGFDFHETFSPVVKPNTIRVILTLVVSSGWSVVHLDVNNAFLHSDLREDIYMRQPPGFEKGPPGMVCKLNKFIYGLKQASRSWFLAVQKILLGFGFSQSRADTYLFYRIRGKEVLYLLIYVDDMLITVMMPLQLRKLSLTSALIFLSRILVKFHIFWALRSLKLFMVCFLVNLHI